MARFIVRRLVGMVLVLFAVSIVVFLIFNVIPNSDPAQRLAGKNATPVLVKSIEQEWGFDESLPVQYGEMMKKIFTGELISYDERAQRQRTDRRRDPDHLLALHRRRDHLDVLRDPARLPLGAPGRRLARSQPHRASRSPASRCRSSCSPRSSSTSSPTSSKSSPPAATSPLTEDPIQWANHLILPWFTLAILNIGFYSRVLRSNMLDSLREDYVRTARAKGLSERRVMVKHVLRNSLIPIVTLFGLDFGATIGGGAIITEVIFSLNGVGGYAAEAINNLDLPPIMGVTMFGAFFVVFFNAVADILYAYLDPRIRLGSSAAVSAPPLLSVKDLRVGFSHRSRPAAGGRRGLLRPGAREKCWRSSASRARARASPRRRSSASPARPTR